MTCKRTKEGKKEEIERGQASYLYAQYFLLQPSVPYTDITCKKIILIQFNLVEVNVIELSRRKNNLC